MCKCFGVKNPKLRIITLFGMVMWFLGGNLAAQPDTLWTKTYGGPETDVGYSVCGTQDGGYIITGKTTSFGAGWGDVYLVKTDANGDTLWTRTYGSPKFDEGRSVQQTQDGGYIIAGHTSWFYGARMWDVYLLKTDANGDTLWSKTYGGTLSDVGLSIQQTQDGGYIIAGSTWSFGAGWTDVYLLKTDANGDTVWTKTYGGPNFDVGLSVQQTQDGGYIIAGLTWSFGKGETDVYLVKTDASGNIQWEKTCGDTDWDAGQSVQQTRDGGYIIAGWTASFGAGGVDVYLIKTEPDVVGIEEGDKRLEVGALKLEVYPNPFTQKTVIHLLLLGSSQKPARIKIYDRAGKLVKTLENASTEGGYSIEWDGTDNNNKKVAPGVYFARVLVDKSIATKKLIKLR